VKIPCGSNSKKSKNKILEEFFPLRKEIFTGEEIPRGKFEFCG